MSRIITWLENLGRQLDNRNAPPNIVIEMPSTYHSFTQDLKDNHWLLCYGEDREGFDGIVLRCNGRKFFILEEQVDY